MSNYLWEEIVVLLLLASYVSSDPSGQSRVLSPLILQCSGGNSSVGVVVLVPVVSGFRTNTDNNINSN